MQQAHLAANQESLCPITPTGSQCAVAQNAEMQLSWSVTLLATKPSIITVETAWNDSPGPSHYCSLNSVSSIFCIIPDSQLSTLSQLQNQMWTCNAFNLQCLSNSNWFLFIWSCCSEKTTHESWCQKMIFKRPR